MCKRVVPDQLDAVRCFDLVTVPNICSGCSRPRPVERQLLQVNGEAAETGKVVTIYPTSTQRAERLTEQVKKAEEAKRLEDTKK